MHRFEIHREIAFSPRMTESKSSRELRLPQSRQATIRFHNVEDTMPLQDQSRRAPEWSKFA